MITGANPIVEVLIENALTQWKKKEFGNCDIYFAGHLQVDSSFLEEDNAIDYIFNMLYSKDVDINLLEQQALRFGGSWGIIINTSSYTLMISDIFRTMPIFYSYENNTLVVSDNTNSLVEKLKKIRLKKESMPFYIQKGTARSGETLIDNLFDVEAGEMVFFNGNIQKIQYYFMPSKQLNVNEKVLLEKLNAIYGMVFIQLVKYCENNPNLPIFLPLSGGMDSRLLAWAIKKYNIKNRIISFTYGRDENVEEARISKQLALKLGFEWEFIHYTKEKWQEVRGEFEILAKNFSMHKSVIHLQDFISIKYLKEKYGQGIVVVGHLMDHFAGLSIPNELKFQNKISVNKLISGNRIYENKLSSYEHFYKNTRTASFILNSVRTYEYFGLKFYLPYANVELASFWYRTPTRYRIERNLFRKYLNKYAYKDEYKFLLDIPIALGKRTDDKFLELNDTDKIKIIIKYHLMGTSIAKFLKKILKETIMKEHIKKRNLQIDYVGFYDFFKDKDFEFDIYEKNYHQLIGMYGIKSIKRNKN
jgi:asparagine synthase (glutamine-hydrolysing)